MLGIAQVFRFRFLWGQTRAGSSPVNRMKTLDLLYFQGFLFYILIGFGTSALVGLFAIIRVITRANEEDNANEKSHYEK